MAKNITVYFADGSSHIYQGVPDTVTADQAIARAKADFSSKQIRHVSREDIFEEAVEPTAPAKRPGFFGGLKMGTEALLSSGRTALGSVTGSPEEAALAGLARQEEISKEYGEGLSLDKLKQIYEEQGVLPAAKEFVSEIPGAIGAQLPNIGAMAASARLAARVPGPLPVKAAGAVVGALAPSLFQQYAGDIEAQAAAQQERGETVDINRARALGAAVPQAALDVAGAAIPLGRTLLGKIFGKEVESLLGAGEREAAERLAKESLKATLAKGTAIGALAEIPTEVAQQALTRLNAGLSLTDESAQKEYADTALQVSLLAPIGAVGRLSERSAARGRIAEETAREEAEARAQAMPETPPEVPPEAAPEAPIEAAPVGETPEQQVARQSRAEDDFRKMVLSGLQGKPTVDEFQSLTGLSRSAARAEMDRMVDAGFLQKDAKTGRYSLVPEYSQFEFVEPGEKPRTTLKEYPTEEAAPEVPAPVSRRQMDLFEGAPSGGVTYVSPEGVAGPSPEAVKAQAQQDDFFRARAEEQQRKAIEEQAAAAKTQEAKAQADRAKVLEALQKDTSIKSIQGALGVPYNDARKYMMDLRDQGVVEYSNNAWRLTTEPAETAAPTPPKAPKALQEKIFDDETYQKALDAVANNGKATVPLVQKVTGSTRTQAAGFMRDLREKGITNAKNEVVRGVPSDGVSTEPRTGRGRTRAGVPVLEGKARTGKAPKPVGGGLAGTKDVAAKPVGGEAAGEPALTPKYTLPTTPETEDVLRRASIAYNKGSLDEATLRDIKLELAAANPDYPFIHSLIDNATRPVRATLNVETGEGLEFESLLAPARVRVIRNIYKREAEKVAKAEKEKAPAPKGKAPVKEAAPAGTKPVETLRSEYSSRAIDALSDEKISEKTYENVREALKSLTPDFAKIDDMLEGKARGRKATTEESAARAREAGKEGGARKRSTAKDLEDAADALLRGAGYDEEGELRFQRGARNPQVNTTAFTRWFSDSKIKDYNGVPIRMYRGVYKDFPDVTPRTAGAIFVSPSPEFASKWATGSRKPDASPVVYPVYVKAENPFDYDNPAHVNALRQELNRLKSPWVDIRRVEEGNWDTIEEASVQRAIKNLGHDGFYIREDRVKNLAVYDSTQLKSASGNYGSFDPNNPDIRYVLNIDEKGVVPHEAVVKVVKDTTAGWRNAPNIRVVRNVTELPEQYRTIPANARGFYAPSAKTVYVISENATSVEGAKATAFHESLGHYGLDKKFRGDLDAVLGKMYESPEMKRAADKWLADNPDTYAHLPESKQFSRAVEEVLAERSEAGPIKESGLRGLYNRLVAFVRDWMRRNGFGVRYSDNDVTQILRQAHEMVIGQPESELAYSFDPQLRYQLTPDEQRRQDETLARSYMSAEDKKPNPTKEILARGREAFSKLTPAVRRGLFSGMSPNQLANEFEHAIPSLRTRHDLLNEKGAYLRKQMEHIAETVKKSDDVLKQYSYAERQRIYNIFNKTTLDQIEVLDDAKRGWVADKSNPLYREFAALDPEVRDIYRKMRETYDNQSNVALGILYSIAEPSQREKFEKQLKVQRLKVYLPLFRTGDHWLSYTAEDGELVKRSFETIAERDQAYREAQKAGATDIARYHNFEHMARTAPPTGFFGQVMTALQKSKADKDTINSIVSAYLNLLPAKSVLQMARKREGTAGFIRDVTQAYANVAEKNATYITNLKYNQKLDEVMGKVREEAGTAELLHESNPDDPKGIHPDVKSDLMQATETSHQNMLNPQYNPVMAGLQYVTYVTYLGGNVSTAYVTLMHLPTVAYPTLSRISGFDNARAAMAKANKHAINYTYSKGKGVPADLMRVLEQGKVDGVLGERQAQDIAEFKTSGTDKYLGFKARIDNVLNKTLGMADRHNREVTLLASYDLNRAKLAKTGLSGEELHNAAFAAAKRDVYDTLGSVFSAARANILRHPLGQLFFTFKQDGMNRAYLLARAFKESVAGESPEVKRAARTQLLGFYAMAGLLAGVSGMPLVGWGEMVAQLLIGTIGDDDTYDASEEVQKAVGLLPYKGLLNYALNINVSDRIGWDGMFWRDDPQRRSQLGFLNFAAEKAFGPMATYAGQNIPRAWDHIQNGRLERAAETVMPVAAANVLKGIRYGLEGATTKDGLPIKKDVNAYNAFMQVLGFSPADLAEIQKENSGRIGLEKKIYTTRDALLAQFVAAKVNGDVDGIAEALDKIRKFSAKYPGVAIQNGELSGAMTKHHKRISQSVNGIYINPKLRPQILAAYPGMEEEEEEEEEE